MDEPKVLLTSAGDSFAIIKTSAEDFLNSFETQDLKETYLFDNYCALLYCYQKDKARKLMGEKVSYFEELEESVNFWRSELNKAKGKVSLYEADGKVKMMWDDFEKRLKGNESKIITKNSSSIITI